MINLLTYNKWSNYIIKLIEDMKTTPQSAIHHAEGDVYLHTQMVLEQVMKNYGSYSETDKKILEYTAIFHDIAKPMTTIFEDGDWRSPGHAKLGEKVVREILTDLNFETRELICALIRLHGLPIWFDSKSNPEMDVIKASLRCNLNMLSYFAECDFKGRICNDLDDSLFKIELFKEKAQNLNCFDKPYEFTSDWARLYYFKNGGYPGKEIYEPKGGTLVLMVGLPGSGKNTWIKNNWKDKVIELDEIRKELKIKPTDSAGQGTVANVGKERMRKCLRKKENVL
jgi:putative nucleotidyltransferase with HDIG domain